jgi:transposase
MRPIARGEQPLTHLAGFAGGLQADGYVGYRQIAGGSRVHLAFYWAYVRRRFYKLAAAGPASIASEALQCIAGLYVIEDQIRGQTPDRQCAVRREQGQPINDALQPWLQEETVASQLEDQTGRGDPLRAIALGSSDALH